MGSKTLILDASGSPIERDGHFLTATGTAWTAKELIRHAKENPPDPVIEGILNVGDILLLHGSEESFKSMFVLQMAEDIALGQDLLQSWRVPKPRRVGVIETEMNEVAIGERLAYMFPNENAPDNLRFFGEAALRDWRRHSLEKKFQQIEDWVNSDGIEVLMIDTANDFFRGPDNPSEERAVGKFFDELRSLKVGGKLAVRHDRKKSEVDDQVNSNERIRGSAEWKEDPEVIISLVRLDRRTNKVAFEVGKLRYGMKPEPCELWFDASTFRLTGLPPVISVLGHGRQSRKHILDECARRFGLAERTTDDMLKDQGQYLEERNKGHEKTFDLDPKRSGEAPWVRFLGKALPAGQRG